MEVGRVEFKLDDYVAVVKFFALMIVVKTLYSLSELKVK